MQSMHFDHLKKKSVTKQKLISNYLKLNSILLNNPQIKGSLKNIKLNENRQHILREKFVTIYYYIRSGVLVHTFSPSSWKAETGKYL